MDQRERSDEFEEAIRTAMDGRQTRIWTALPATVVSYDADKQTIVAQPTIQARQTDKPPAGQQPVTKLVNLPLCQDVPVLFHRAGGVALTLPIAVGDEVLLHFASRGIDYWWQNGGIQAPAEARMHDLSDAFATFGPTSQPRKLSNVSTATAQLRSEDGSTYIEIDPDGQIVTIVAPGGVNITGTLTVTEDVIAGAGNISLVNHVHTDVTAGGDDTGPPSG